MARERDWLHQLSSALDEEGIVYEPSLAAWAEDTNTIEAVPVYHPPRRRLAAYTALALLLLFGVSAAISLLLAARTTALSAPCCPAPKSKPVQTATGGAAWGLASGDIPSGRPIDPTRSDWLITQNWAQHRVNEGLNVGALDFAFVNNVQAVGSPIHATQRGIAYTLVDRGDGTGYGNAVYILGYIDPATGVSYNTVYGHFYKPAYVKDGQAVQRGDVLGGMGSTGYTTGPHVHFEVWRCGRPAKPSADNVHHGSAGCENIDPASFTGS